MKFRVLLAAALGLALVTTQAATFTVSVTDDSGPGSLRQAIVDANAAIGGASIAFTASGTIILASPLPTITTNVTITGPGTNVLTVSGNNAVQVLSLATGATAAISDLTIAEGRATGYANGAGIANAGTLTLLKCALINNTNIAGWGGAVFNSGTLVVTNSTFIGNLLVGENAMSAGAGAGGGAAAMGAGIYTTTGTVTIVASSFIANRVMGGTGGDAGSGGPASRGAGFNGGLAGNYSTPDGQPGGFGGGGGGGGGGQGNGGAGGFGGGGGGGGSSDRYRSGAGGKAGFGAGSGGNYWNNDTGGGGGGGGGGAAVGPAIFAESGGTVILDSSFINNRANGGLGGHRGYGQLSTDGSNGQNILASIGARDATVVIKNSGVNFVTTNTPMEAQSYSDAAYVVPVGTPQVLADGRPVLGSFVTRGSTRVSLQTSFLGGTVIYSFNNLAPRTHTTFYNGPFAVEHSAILRAVAYNSDFTASVEMESVEITILPKLTVTTTGGGTITVAPTDGPYFSNSVAQIIAEAAPGFTFLQWLGDATGTNPVIEITMNRDKYVQALFGTAIGTTVVGGGSIIADPSLPFYPYGTTVRFTAQSQSGSYFARWGSATTGTNNPLNFLVSSAGQTVAAVFSTLTGSRYALTVLETGHGHVVASPQASFYSSGQSVTLTATPEPGQDFLGWSGVSTLAQNPVTVTMYSNTLITAAFTTRPTLRVGTPLEGLVEDGFRLTLMGEFGAPYTILGSTNLTDWIPVGIVTNTFGTIQLTDPAATNLLQRFYRAKSQ